MIIVLHGEEEYCSREELSRIEKKYNDTYRRINFFKLDWDSKSHTVADLKSILGSHSLFHEKKLVVVEHAFSVKISIDALAQMIRDEQPTMGEDTVLVFYESVLISPTVQKLVSDFAKFYEFKKMTGSQVSRWIEKEVKLLGGEIDVPSVSLLTAHLSGDLFKIKNEIMKLVNFNPRISKSTIEAFLVRRGEASIFEMLDQMNAQNARGAFSALERLLSYGESEVAVLTMIAGSVRNMLKLKNLPPGAEADGIHPYVAGKLRRVIHEFSLEKLKSIYRGLFEADLRMKSGRGDPRALLTRILFMFAR